MTAEFGACVLALALQATQVSTEAQPPIPACTSSTVAASIDLDSVPEPARRYRLEIRRCLAATSGVLQVSVLDAKADHVLATFETNRFSVVQLVTIGRIVVLETAGASSNVLQVIEVRDNTAKLVFYDADKCYAGISTSRKVVSIKLPCMTKVGTLRFDTGLY
jgi:hypothetical protein